MEHRLTIVITCIVPRDIIQVYTGTHRSMTHFTGILTVYGLTPLDFITGHLDFILIIITCTTAVTDLDTAFIIADLHITATRGIYGIVMDSEIKEEEED